MTTQLDDLIVKLILDSTGFNTGVANATTTGKGLSSQLSGVFNEIGLGGVAAFASVTGAIAGSIAAIKEIYQSTLDYGDSVRLLTQLSGTSSEESSRLIQVANEHKISMSDLNTASKTLAKEGIPLTIDALVKLSDAYSALATPAEKEAFLLQNFGARGGTAFVELMQAGGQAIRDEATAISDNNILSEHQLTLQRENEAALHRATVAYDGLKMVIGNLLMGPGAALLNWLANSIAGWGQFFEFEQRALSGDWKLGPGSPSGQSPSGKTFSPTPKTTIPDKGERDSSAVTNIITVNNPVPAAAEVSIDKTLKNLSYLGNR